MTVFWPVSFVAGCKGIYACGRSPISCLIDPPSEGSLVSLALSAPSPLLPLSSIRLVLERTPGKRVLLLPIKLRWS